MGDKDVVMSGMLGYGNTKPCNSVGYKCHPRGGGLSERLMTGELEDPRHSSGWLIGW